MKKIPNKVRYSICIISLLVIAVMISAHNKADVYEVYVNGESVGFAENQEIVEEALVEAKQQLVEETKNLPIIEPEIDYVNSKKIFKATNSKEGLETSIYEEIKNESLDGKQQAYTVKIDDYTASLSTKAEVRQVLEAAKNQYDKDKAFMLVMENKSEDGGITASLIKDELPDLLEETMSGSGILSDDTSEAATKTKEELTPSEYENTIQVAFAEDIEIQKEYVDQDQVKTAKDVMKDLTKENVYYETKKGDTLAKIAKAHNLKKSELLELNPDLTSKSKLEKGDQVVVAITEPNLTVILQKEETYDTTYETEAEVIEDSNMFEDEKEIIEEAVPGVETVTALVNYENGIEIDREILQKSIKKEATSLKVKIGTKVRSEFIKPINGGTFSSPFGERWGRMHKGIDWSVPVGTRVNASAAGSVVFAGTMNGYGFCVTILHSDGKQTRYAHLNEILVKNGQTVEQGEQIALSGNTGRSTGPHVHFEIIINGEQVDPLTYLN